MEHKMRFICLLLIILKCVQSYRILGVFPMPGGSHQILSSTLMKTLANAGHDITYMGPFKNKDLPKNGSWVDVELTGVAEDFFNSLKDTNLFDDSNKNTWEKMTAYESLMILWVNRTLHHPNTKKLLRSEQKFDVIIMEQFMNDAHKIFAHIYNCPLILLSSSGANPWVNNVVGNPSPISYIPHFSLNGNFSDGFTFVQRTQNLLLSIFDLAFNNLHFEPLQDEVLHSAFPDAPSVNDLNDNVELVLLNSHTSYKQAVPVVPNMVEIGGYHIEPPKKLPNDLQEFLDNAKEGVIYFSLGSNLKSKDMPESKRKVFLDTFRKLKYKIIWKFENENLPGKPDNVLIRSWLPQNDILAHPNVKLFITHGGLLSTTETIYHGVPVLTIPIFADQFLNANQAENLGYALQIKFTSDEDFTEENLTHKIQELIQNPKYKKNVQWRSELYHDRPQTPRQTLVYWVEYVIRNNGAKHLMVAGAKQPLYQYLMIDVILFLILSVLVPLKLVALLFKTLFCRKNKSSKKQKTQ